MYCTYDFEILELGLDLDPTSDTSILAGVNLQWAGNKTKYIECMGITEMDKGRLPILSESETAAWLNDGHFDRTFKALRQTQSDDQIVFLIALCMVIGAKVPQEHREYVGNIYGLTDVPQNTMQQFQRAIEEYINGVPYRPQHTGNIIESRRTSEVRASDIETPQ